MERFWSKVNVTEGCWTWTASYDWYGYGLIYFGSKHRKACKAYKAHRVAYQMVHGPITEANCVLHKCDNPPCVNPDHLFLGTRVDNILDMVQKARHRGAEGIKNCKAKLTEAQVIEIRRLYQTKLRVDRPSQEKLARQFGVDQVTISRAVNGKGWKHI